jgi:predicted AAA+ superfamily ATPase
MIYLHLRVLAGLLTPPAKLYYWRQRTGAEVDFVVEYGRRRLAIEVKQSARPRYQDTAGLRAFLAGDPQATGILLHGGEESLSIGERLLAVPWSAVTGFAAAG